jgi:endo-1,4-beta-xylanase
MTRDLSRRAVLPGVFGSGIFASGVAAVADLLADPVREGRAFAGALRPAAPAAAAPLSSAGGRVGGSTPTAGAERVPLRAAAPFPVGVCLTSAARQDPALLALIRREFSSSTPEWEMKMEAVVSQDGALSFTRPDAVCALAEDLGLRLHGHALVWYAEAPPALALFADRPPLFRRALGDYIGRMVGRYRGRAASWDVVNEAVKDDESGGLRSCLYSRAYGPSWIADAFHLARQADPHARLFLNDYNLERTGKRAGFLRLAESLLKAGAPLGGLGSQSHLDLSTPKGAVLQAVRDLGALGLPIHLSELDVSIAGSFLLNDSDAQRRQADLFREAAAAMMSLPAAQRFGVTLWGARDRDSWLERPPYRPGAARPLLFDDAGRPKAAAAAFEAGLSGV